MASVIIHNQPVYFSAILKQAFCCLLPMIISVAISAQKTDTAGLLQTIHIEGVLKKNNFSSPTPVQSLDRESLQQINAPSVGDAARYFSGALVKDYGGIGGLKTISVRSLGAANTGIVYDGIPVSDLQTGQIDLSRFSTTFLQSLELRQGAVQQTLQPARTYAAGASLLISTNTFAAVNFLQPQWQAGIHGGSFNTWQPFAGLYQPLKKNLVVSINAEALYSDGNYPIYIDNGNYSGKTKRSNADIKSIQEELNLLKLFRDSATLQVKAGGYHSERGLPGAIVFFNDRSAQRLGNADYFLQSRYQKKINAANSILAAVKYSHDYTRYIDPDYLNNQGGLDNRYTQQELYASIAGKHAFNDQLSLSLASDMARNWLDANTDDFAFPRRTSFWENMALQYNRSRWQLHTDLLYTGINDQTITGNAAGNKNKFTPAVSLAITPSAASPFLFRFFYKTIFRMPTFNDLYYRLVGTVALRPEFAKQYNAGITYTRQYLAGIKRFSISADVYYNEVKDKIVAVPNQNLFVWTIVNLGKVSIKGMDVNAEVKGRLSETVDWFTRIAYTWQQALDITNKSGSTYHNRIPYTPDHSGSGLLSFSYHQWEAGYNVLFSGSRYTLGENNAANYLAGWLTQDISLLKTLPFHSCKLSIRAALNNITGARYEVIHYFPMPGRSFKISLFINNL